MATVKKSAKKEFMSQVITVSYNIWKDRHRYATTNKGVLAFTQLFHVPVRSTSSSRRSRDNSHQQQLSTTAITDSSRMPSEMVNLPALLTTLRGGSELDAVVPSQLAVTRRRRRRRTGSESSCCEDGKPLVIKSSVDVGVIVHWTQVGVPIWLICCGVDDLSDIFCCVIRRKSRHENNRQRVLHRAALRVCCLNWYRHL